MNLVRALGPGTFAGAVLFWLAAAQLGAQSAGNSAQSEADAKSNRTQDLMQALLAQGVPAERVLGVDPNGVPVLCGTDAVTNLSKSKAASPANQPPDPLPPNSRAWECIPCVVRFDGVDSFRLEVNANGPVNAVRLQVPPSLIPSSGGAQQTLRDDGQGGDRVAGDFVFTSVSMVINTNWPMAEFLLRDTNSPAGLDFFGVGSPQIVETTGETNEFLVWPDVGVLRSDIPARTATMLLSNVAASGYLINIQSPDQASQKILHGVSAEEIHRLGTNIFAALPDMFDFLMFFTADHIEGLPRTAINNFNAGLHNSVQVNYTGTGQQPFNNSADVGSKGRLLGLNFIDTNGRGVWSANATHEIVHQWAAFMSTVALNYDYAHYQPRASTASLVGGHQWIASGSNSSYVLICEEGRSGAHFAPPLDKYFMGLIEGSNVSPLRVYNAAQPPPLLLCGQTVNQDYFVTIEQIQQANGIRTPTPATAQKEFFIGFVAETHDRLFNATEMTFYDILAEHYTRALPANSPAPYLGQNWVPITRFFGEGTVWHSGVMREIQPAFTSVVRSGPGTVQLSGKGARGVSYALQSSTNLASWVNISSITAGTNGMFQVSAPAGSPNKFYRLRWP